MSEIEIPYEDVTLPKDVELDENLIRIGFKHWGRPIDNSEEDFYDKVEDMEERGYNQICDKDDENFACFHIEGTPLWYHIEPEYGHQESYEIVDIDNYSPQDLIDMAEVSMQFLYKWSSEMEISDNYVFRLDLKNPMNILDKYFQGEEYSNTEIVKLFNNIPSKDKEDFEEGIFGRENFIERVLHGMLNFSKDFNLGTKTTGDGSIIGHFRPKKGIKWNSIDDCKIGKSG